MNELLFLGTGAADFSAEELNNYKDTFENKSTRRCSCALLNGRYLIDCGPHVLDSIRIANVDATKITDIFLTHFHGDHFNLENLKAIVSIASRKPVKIYVRYDAKLPEIDGADIIFMDDVAPYKVNDDLTVTGFDANHDAYAYPHHFLFEIGDKKIFYGLDGGWFLNRSYNYLRKFKLDILVLDSTCGDYVGDYRLGEHNSIPMIRLILASFKTVGIIDANTKVILSHLARSLHKPHDETQEIVNNDNLLVAYDGMIVNV